jgi:hypothetical protein
MKKGYKIGNYGWIFDFRTFKQVRKIQEIDIKRLGSKIFKIEKVRTKIQKCTNFTTMVDGKT